jgi:hypothetical protein
MNKKLQIALAVLVLGGTLTVGSYRTQIAQAASSMFRSGQDASNMRTSSSTTSPAWLVTGTGTATIGPFSSSDLKSVTVYMNTMATSSSGAFNSILEIQPYASDDNIDFFPYDNTKRNQAQALSNATTSIQFASTTEPFRFSPSTIGATTSKAFSIDLIPARYTRLVASLVSSTTPYTQKQSMNIWMNAVGELK